MKSLLPIVHEGFDLPISNWFTKTSGAFRLNRCAESRNALFPHKYRVVWQHLGTFNLLLYLMEEENLSSGDAWKKIKLMFHS